jgi:hypothetical protein
MADTSETSSKLSLKGISLETNGISLRTAAITPAAFLSVFTLMQVLKPLAICGAHYLNFAYKNTN